MPGLPWSPDPNALGTEARTIVVLAMAVPSQGQEADARLGRRNPQTSPRGMSRMRFRVADKAGRPEHPRM
eukprot:7016982-Pyramimonas_sp.AAC.2